MSTAQMRPEQLLRLMTKLIPAREPLMIIGGPGIGKTMLSRKGALLSGADYIYSNPSIEDPTVPGGLPWPNSDKNEARFLPFGSLAAALKSTKLTVWDLPDLGQATQATQAAYMQVLDGHINQHTIPKNVVIIASTNRRKDRAGVQGILSTIISRFSTVVELVVNNDDWINWALESDISPEIISYLRFCPDSLNDFDPSLDMEAFPCPRTWERLDRIMKTGIDKDLELATYSGTIGSGHAAKFIGFLRVYRDLPDLDGIILNPETSIIPESISARYAVATGLARKATKGNFKAITIYSERLRKEAGKPEFAVLLIKDATKRDESLCNTAAFAALASGDFQKLLIS